MSKIAFVTGASTGLGHELARQLVQAGYDVALVARRFALLEALKKELDPLGRRVLVIAADVSRWEDIKGAVDRTEKELGPIDLLIANAGVSLDAPLKRFNVAEARLVYEVNVIGLMQTVAAVLPYFMERKRGHIVGVSSLAAYLSFPRSTVYCSSKAAVSSYLEGLRIELMPLKIPVTTICPGFVRTPMTQKNKFKMPFLLDAPDAVRIMMRGIEARKATVHFPSSLAVIVQLLRLVPKPLFRQVLLRLRPG
ncbi:SDR family NAD(P)-dependent oxidoreductase [Oligoflexus tunisiensis]|uniref:SDR family NAD(P)-dependent oxidoreductase n=1 Tax=Oligoflexus tunisiensis TaxID=708132 RepID=UPI00159F02BE|nr:SDR family NAD(P)-dependent oxidoreductase [Oligoflexus tunisiensis]